MDAEHVKKMQAGRLKKPGQSKPFRIRPTRAVRRKCLFCCLNKAEEVRLCPSTDCDFYPYRLGHKRVSLKVVHKKCMDCIAGDRRRIDKCTINYCPTWLYRSGSRRQIAQQRATMPVEQGGVETMTVAGLLTHRLDVL